MGRAERGGGGEALNEIPKHKSKIQNPKKRITKKMANEQDSKRVYDLEERTFLFAKAVRLFVKTLPKTLGNLEDAKQLIKASGSVGANYREANEALGDKDFLMRIKISRKEAKESLYWLRLICETNSLVNSDEGEQVNARGNRTEKDTIRIRRKVEIKRYRCFVYWLFVFVIYLLFGACHLEFQTNRR